MNPYAIVGIITGVIAVVVGALLLATGHEERKQQDMLDRLQRESLERSESLNHELFHHIDRRWGAASRALEAGTLVPDVQERLEKYLGGIFRS